METKVTGSETVMSSRKRGQVSSWTVEPAEEEEEECTPRDWHTSWVLMLYVYVPSECTFRWKLLDVLDVRSWSDAVSPADSNPTSQVTWCNLSFESFRRLLHLEGQGVAWSSFGVAPVLQCNDLIELENTINPEREKHIFKLKLEQFKATIPPIPPGSVWFCYFSNFVQNKYRSSYQTRWIRNKKLAYREIGSNDLPITTLIPFPV